MCCGEKRSAMKGSGEFAVSRSAPSSAGVQSIPADTRAHAQPWGQRGFETALSGPSGQRVRTPVALAVSSFRPKMNIRYLGSSPIRLRGSVSGRSYQFSVTRPVQPLDSGDAASLLNTRLFRRA